MEIITWNDIIACELLAKNTWYNWAKINKEKYTKNENIDVKWTLFPNPKA